MAGGTRADGERVSWLDDYGQACPAYLTGGRLGQEVKCMGLRQLGARAGKGVSLCVMLFAAFGCGSSATPTPHAVSTPSNASATSTASTTAGRSQRLRPVTFVFDFLPSATDAPFYVTKDLGYFKEQGLDVTLKLGKDPAVATDLVVTGKVDMAKDSPPDMAIAVSKGAPIISIAGTVEGDPFGLVYPSDKPLKRPTDVYGKTIGVPAGTEAATLWKAFVAVNHLNVSRIHIVNTSLATQAGLLGEGKLDAVSGSGASLMPVLKSVGVNASALYYQDFGVHSMSENVVVTKAFAKQHSDILKRFLAALAKGWVYSEQHPKQAAEDFIKSSPQAGKQNLALVTRAISLNMQFLHSPATQDKPWGYQSLSDWQGELQFVKQFEGVKTSLPATAFFTNDYLPRS